MLKLVTTVVATTIAAIVFVAAAIAGVVSSLFGGGSSGGQPSPHALADIPADYLVLYRHAAATCPGLDWSILAAIGKVETNHGRLDAPGVTAGSNAAGAQGPMQFLPATFAAYDEPIPPGGSSPPSPYNPVNAIHAAARYLCASGARDGRDTYGAIYTYNHADWYVRKVLTQAEQYRATATITAPQAGGWAVPTQGRCTSGFGPRDGEFHQGQDIAAPIGTPIVAASGGTVINTGPASGYGQWVRITHPRGITTTYGHIDQALVVEGQPVHTGQAIATVGNRGQSTGPHLHFQIEGDGGGPVDPVTFYQQHHAPPLCNGNLR